jgi:hypothetical protein
MITLRQIRAGYDPKRRSDFIRERIEIAKQFPKEPITIAADGSGQPIGVPPLSQETRSFLAKVGLAESSLQYEDNPAGVVRNL